MCTWKQTLGSDLWKGSFMYNWGIHVPVDNPDVDKQLKLYTNTRSSSSSASWHGEIGSLGWMLIRFVEIERSLGVLYFLESFAKVDWLLTWEVVWVNISLPVAEPYPLLHSLGVLRIICIFWAMVSLFAMVSLQLWQCTCVALTESPFVLWQEQLHSSSFNLVSWRAIFSASLLE